MTPAAKLVSLFGHPNRMAELYAPGIQWQLPPSLPYPHPIVGKEAVLAYNRHVWGEVYHPECRVTILDDIGGPLLSAVRFTYAARHRVLGTAMQGEYTLFARCNDEGISEVFEGLDTLGMFDQLSGAGLGSTFVRLRQELGTWQKSTIGEHADEK